MQTCSHDFAPLDSQNVQCEKCEYVRHRIGDDDSTARPVKQILKSDDLLELLKTLPPTTTPNMPVEPFIHEWKPSEQWTWTDTGTADSTAIWKSGSTSIPIKDFTINFTSTVV